MVTAKQAKAIAERYAKAVDLVEQGRVYRLYGYEDRFVVVNGQGQAYLVEHLSGECTCPDSQYRCSKLDIPCKHALAVELYLERQAGGDQPHRPTADDDVVNPTAACQRCGYYTVEVDQRYCPDCQRAVEEEQARRLLEHLF